MTLLRDEEWAAWSDREIARRCLVSPQSVGNYRASLPAPSVQDGQIGPRKVERGGTTFTMRTDRINADRPKREAAPDPAPESPTDRVPWPEKPDAQVRQERAEIAQRFQLFEADSSLIAPGATPARHARSLRPPGPTRHRGGRAEGSGRSSDPLACRRARGLRTRSRRVGPPPETAPRDRVRRTPAPEPTFARVIRHDRRGSLSLRG